MKGDNQDKKESPGSVSFLTASRKPGKAKIKAEAGVTPKRDTLKV